MPALTLTVGAMVGTVDCACGSMDCVSNWFADRVFVYCELYVGYWLQTPSPSIRASGQAAGRRCGAISLGGANTDPDPEAGTADCVVGAHSAGSKPTEVYVLESDMEHWAVFRWLSRVQQGQRRCEVRTGRDQGRETPTLLATAHATSTCLSVLTYLQFAD